MARGKRAKVEDSGIDKVESFLQSYFKQLIFGLAGVVVIFLLSYTGFIFYQSSQTRKADLVGAAEMVMKGPDSIAQFQELEVSAPFLKSYIAVRAAEAWVMLDDNQKALQALAGLNGEFKEIGDGLAFDLGSTVNIQPYLQNGMMKPIWYYRLVLTSKPEDYNKNLELFKSKYPDSKLLGLLENWSI